MPDLREPMDAERIRRILARYDPEWCYVCDRPKNDCACHLDPNGAIFTEDQLVSIYEGVMAEPDYVEFEGRDFDNAEEDRKNREWGLVDEAHTILSAGI